MPRIKIGDQTFEATALSEADYYRYLSMVGERFNPYRALYARVKGLPAPIQCEIFRRASFALNESAFMAIATLPYTVAQLAGWADCNVPVTTHNAVEVFFALLPLIENRERKFTGQEGASKLTEPS